MNAGKVYCQLSEPQRIIWNIEKAYPGTAIGVIAGNLRLKGGVSYEALEQAVNILVKKNDSLRLRITEVNGVLLQYVAEYAPVRFDFVDFSAGGGLRDLFLWDEGITKTPFEVRESPLFYCALYKIGDDEGGVFIKIHRLISDAWSLGLMAEQVIDLYAKLKNGETADETPGPSFITHLFREGDYKKSALFANDREYWNNKFLTLPEPTVMKPHRAGSSLSAKRKILITPLKLTEKIREFCKANKLSIFNLFMSALTIYLNRVTGLDDIVVGATILNRMGAQEKEAIGRFVGAAAPARILINDSIDFKTFAKTVRKENREILRHQKYPMNYLIRDLKKRHPSFDRLYDIVLSYQSPNYFKNTTGVPCVTKWVFPGCQVESLFISIDDSDDNGSISISYGFRTDVFDLREVEILHQHLITLLWHALDNPAKKISKLKMISEKEKQTILIDFNHTYADYPRDRTIHHVFEEQADKTPENTALISEGKKMTYAELNVKANRLAHTLRARGVGPDKIVGILAYRSFEMMIGILGVLKAGGAYLLIDPNDAADRKNDILKDSCTGILLTQRGLVSPIEYSGMKMAIDGDGFSDERSNPAVINGPGDLAYVVYMPGPAGRLKGVMVEHGGVINRINWMQKRYPLKGDSVILPKTGSVYNMSAGELFWWAFSGAACCLEDCAENRDDVTDIIVDNNITAVFFTPSLLTGFLNSIESQNSAERLKKLRYAFSSGGTLTCRQALQFNDLLYKTNGTRLTNMYGPAEAAGEVSFFECSPMPALSSVPIGRPIDNINLYIFDKKHNLLPVGVPGELYIGGAGIARGYLYNPELTAEKFIINPYKRNVILYRTGDRARWYPMGDIEYLGRIDD